MKGKINADVCKRQYGNRITREAVPIIIKYLKTLARLVNESAKEAMEGCIIEEAGRLGIVTVRGGKMRVKTMDEVNSAWKNDTTVENAKKFFGIVYGYFDMNDMAMDQMELHVMAKHQIKYLNIPYSGHSKRFVYQALVKVSWKVWMVETASTTNILAFGYDFGWCRLGKRQERRHSATVFGLYPSPRQAGRRAGLNGARMGSQTGCS